MEDEETGVPKESELSAGTPTRVQIDFIHSLNCSDGNCLLPLCVNSKLLFNHTKRCTDANCSICQQLKHQAPNHTQLEPRTQKPTSNSSASKFRQGQCIKSSRLSPGHRRNVAMMTRFSIATSKARTLKHLPEHETVPSDPANNILNTRRLDPACRHEDFPQVQTDRVNLDPYRLGTGGKIRKSSRQLLKVRFFGALLGLMRLITKTDRRGQIFMCIGLLRGALHEIQNLSQCK